ncbi:MAG: hypothetical protein ACI9G1_003616 [Pirellulaceae bacterium]|jgi:hypothetical protein
MDISRNQWFLAGLVLVALGLQFRFVDSFVLNEPCAKFIAKRFNKQQQAANTSPFPMFLSNAAAPSIAKRPVRPPKWLGWLLLSVGGVLVLHSLAMPRP